MQKVVVSSQSRLDFDFYRWCTVQLVVSPSVVCTSVICAYTVSNLIAYSLACTLQVVTIQAS